MPGNRILVNKIGGASSLHRGDLVDFDGTRTFDDRALGPGSVPSSALVMGMGSIAARLSVHLNESDYVKRVVGLPGDPVVCCDVRGLLTVNDVAVQEPYHCPEGEPSGVVFDVRVPAWHVWLLGDHDSDSADSRAHLGDPGGGMVRLDDVIGRAATIYRPAARVGIVDASASLEGIPTAALGRRP